MELVTLLFYSLLGLCIGVITGLTPGLHPNTMGVILLGFSFGNPLLLAVLLVSAAVAHSFLDFIPSILFGAPDPATALSVLPGHRMIMKGKGYEAIVLTVIGGSLALVITISILPLATVFFKSFYTIIKSNIHLILLCIIGYMILRDRNPWGIVVLLLSGSLGYLVLRNGLLGEFALFPMLTGLFGLSMILKSIKDKPSLPHQSFEVGFIPKKVLLTGGLIGSFSGILTGILPGVGAAQAAFISSEILRKKNEKTFMIALGGVNTAVSIFSLFALWLIAKPRSGIASFVKELLGALNLHQIIIFCGLIAFVSGLAGVLTLIISKFFLRFFKRVNYFYLNLFVFGFLLFLISFFTGLLGMGIAVLSTLIGLVCVFSGVRKSYLMGCLILPTILFYFGF